MEGSPIKLRKRYLIPVLLLGVLLFGREFGIYTGGWEVQVHANRAQMDGSSWISTYPAEWEHDFDAKYSGGPDLYFHIGGDPYHVNEYYVPSPKDEPIEIFEKTTKDRIYKYDAHLYAMDLTLQVDADYQVKEDLGSNSIESETSYAKDRFGDGGSHTYYVQFTFEIRQWERFADEVDSWAGVMSVNLYKNPTVGTQAIQYADFKEYSYLEEKPYTQIVHNAKPAQAGKLNCWVDAGSFRHYTEAAEVAPDTRIPQKVSFQVGAEFRSGALLGKDSLGNIEDIYPLDPYVIFHISFAVLTVHEYYLEPEPQVITQTTPAAAGEPGEQYEGSIWEQLGDAFWEFADKIEELWPWGGFIGLIIIVVVAFLAIQLLKGSPQMRLIRRFEE